MNSRDGTNGLRAHQFLPYYLCGDGWRRKQICAGTGGDGSRYLRERVGMDSNYTGTVGDGTEILSLCRPLVSWLV